MPESTSRSLESALWVSLPRTLGRQSALLGLILADGQYLRRSGATSTNVALASLFFGILAGAFHPALFGFASSSGAFSASIVFTALALIIGTLSGQAGLCLVIGYAVADTLIFQGIFKTNQPFGALAGLILSYLLLFQLICVIPYMSRGIARKSFEHTGLSGAVASFLRNFLIAVVAVLFAAFLIYAWTAALPFLIRPFHIFAGEGMVLATINAIQLDHRQPPPIDHPLIIVGVISQIVRMAIEQAWKANLDQSDEPEIQPRRWPSIIAIPFRAAFTTFMLAGFIESWSSALIVFLIWLALYAAISRMDHSWQGWFRLVEKIPFLIRVVIGFGGAFATAFVILKYFENQVERWNALLPILLCGMIGAVFFAFLIPPLKTKTSEEAE